MALDTLCVAQFFIFWWFNVTTSPRRNFLLSQGGAAWESQAVESLIFGISLGKSLSFNTTSALRTFCGRQELFLLPEFPSVDTWNGVKRVAGTSHSEFSSFSGIKLFQPSFNSCFKVPAFKIPPCFPCPQTNLFSHEV